MHIKINSKWIQDLNKKVKPTKELEENMGELPYNFGGGNISN